MPSTAKKTLRERAKAIPGLYPAVGYCRYLAHRLRLAREDMRYTGHEDPPIPPPRLRYRVHRSLDAGVYRQVGTRIAGDIAGILEAHQIAPSPGSRILEFGSGPGRVAYWFKQRFPNCVMDCSDIDDEAIGWAKRHLGEIATFSCNAPHPPMAYPDDTFDLVYCISVFTHLDQGMQDAWLRELGRIVKPSGHIIATTHGRPTFGACTPAELQDIHAKGFLYRKDRSGFLKLDGLPDFYQTAFHTEAYVRSRWSRHLDIVAHIEGGLSGHQDVVVMRKPGAAPSSAP